MTRPDISRRLIHLTKGETDNECIKTLVNIMMEGKLKGSSGFIKGGYNCVCFSEAPISSVATAFSKTDIDIFKYRPFGVSVSKECVFREGGRPVIYQTDEEFEDLPESMKYRHVRYNPLRSPKPIDLTWEREWRIKTDVFNLDPDECTIILPRRRLIKKLNDLLKEKGIERRWTYIALDDLGVNVELIIPKQ